MARLRANAMFGTLSASLSADAVTFSNAGFADLPLVESPNILVLTLDPDEVYGAAEIVHVTVHGTGETPVTVVRGREDTTARSHVSGTKWVHAPTAKDFEITDLVTVSGTTEVTVAGSLVLSGSPTGTNQAATKGYVDQVAAGQRFKDACRVATTASVTIATALNAGDTIDGITLVAGDRVLVKDQTTKSQNGIYVAGTTPARSTDADTGSELDSAAVFVTAGTTNEGTSWVQTTNSPTIDSSDIVWALTGGGRTNADEVTLTKVGSTVSIKDLGVSVGKIANSTGATASQYLNGVGGWTTPTTSGTDVTIVSGTTITALQAARGTAPGANGRRIYVPAGTYTLTAQLVLDVPDQSWELHPQAIIRWTGGTPVKVTASGVTWSGGIIDGGYTTRTGKGSNPGLSVDKATNFHIRNATIQDTGTWGLYAQNANRLWVERVYFDQPGSNAILFTTNTRANGGDVEGIWIDGCVVDRTEWSDATMSEGGIKIIGDQNTPEDHLGCAVSAANDNFTYEDHGLADGDQVRVANISAGPTGLTAVTQTYYVVNKATDTFQLSTSAGGAAVAIGGSAGTADVYQSVDGSVVVRLVGVTTDVTADTFTSSAHGMSNGWRVRVEQVTSTTGISTNTDYYVVNKTTNTFQLSATLGGSAVNLTGSNGTCWVRWGFTRLRRVKVTNCDVRLPDIIDDTTPGGGNESIMCQEASETQVMFANNTTRGGSMGVSISGPGAVAVTNNVCTRFSKHGIELAGARDFTVTGNVVDGEADVSGAAPDNGIVIWVESADSNRYPRRGTIVGNTIRNVDRTSSGKGIRLSDPGNAHDAEGSGPKRVSVTVANNAISVGGGAYGIQAIDVSAVTIVGNQIDCAEDGAAKGVGVRLTADGATTLEHIICSNNQIYGAGTAIYLNSVGTATVTQSTFRDNVAIDCGTYRAIDAAYGYGTRFTWWGNRGNGTNPADDEDLSS